MPGDVLSVPWNTQWQIPNQSVLDLINFRLPVSGNQEYRQFNRSQGRSSFQPSISLPRFYIPLHSVLPLHFSLTPNSLYTIPTVSLCTRSQGRLLQRLVWAPSSHCHCQGIYSPAERLEKQTTVPNWPALMAELWLLNYNQCSIIARSWAVGPASTRSSPGSLCANCISLGGSVKLSVTNICFGCIIYLSSFVSHGHSLLPEVAFILLVNIKEYPVCKKIKNDADLCIYKLAEVELKSIILTLKHFSCNMFSVITNQGLRKKCSRLL